MLLFVLVVALIVLVDVSGSQLTPENVPLLYTFVEDKEKKDAIVTADVDGDESDRSSEQLAARAHDSIFGGGSSDEKAK